MGKVGKKRKMILNKFKDISNEQLLLMLKDIVLMLKDIVIEYIKIIKSESKRTIIKI